MIKAIIVDDEPELRELNLSLLKNHFQEIEVVGCCGTVKEGVELIDLYKPQLIFLDIRLTDGTGFNILQKIQPYNYSVIFITAYNEFAIKAIKFCAIDYLLKSIDETEFCEAVERALSTMNNNKLHEQIETFFNFYEKQNKTRKIVLKTTEAISIVDICDIVYCKSDSNYTTFYLKSGEKIMISRGMKEYEDLLSDYGFFRPHHSYLVNLQYISKLDKSDGGFLILKNNSEIPVSSRRKKRLVEVLEQL
jgi:two-component system, LytTR family, response regulator